MKKILAIIFILTISEFTYSNGIADYFPLKTGNVWIYDWVYNGSPSQGGRINVYVSKDSVINSNKYFLCNFPGISQWLRIDSVSGNLYSYSAGSGCSGNPDELLIDSLLSGKFDSTDYCGNIRRICTDTGSVNFFGNNYSKKEFNPVFVLSAESRSYAKGIGIYSSAYGDPFPTNYTLLGCVIDGVVYGDTTLTGVHMTNSIIPEKFSLSQNYPNPFNPSTNLEFGISELGFTSLKIFNSAGKEVATLVNEVLAPGKYNYQFSTVNYQLSSGIYFYKLESGGFVETKRMVLLK